MKKIFLFVLAMFLIIPAVNAAVKTKTKSKADPGYSIAYINDFEGECEIKRKGQDTAEALQDLYIPLYEGDSLSTDADSRVEVIFDDSTIIKVDPRSSLTIKNLTRKDKNKTIIELIKGRVIAIVKKLVEKDRSQSKRGAFYYKFDYKKYKKLDQEGLKFI